MVGFTFAVHNGKQFVSVYVADLVRGKKATEAMADLEFLPKKGARTLHKLIKSAVANASAK